MRELPVAADPGGVESRVPNRPDGESNARLWWWRTAVIKDPSYVAPPRDPNRPGPHIVELVCPALA